MIEEDPVTFQFNGTEYRGAASGLNRRRPLEVGGFDEQPEITIAINIRNKDGDLVFGQDRPKVGSQITYKGKVYRVDRTEVDQFEECLQMDLRSASK
jgi:hypothetical protein